MYNQIRYTLLLPKIISFLFLVVLIFQVYNKITWQHVHRLPGGTLITHSHPFNKTADPSPVKEHHHNQAEYFLLQIVEILFPAIFFGVLLVHIFLELDKPVFTAQHLEIHYSTNGTGRSPPFIIP